MNPIMENLPTSLNQSLFHPDQSLPVFSRDPFDPVQTSKHRPSMLIDLFGLYILNNIQLSPNMLHGASLGNQGCDRLFSPTVKSGR